MMKKQGFTLVELSIVLVIIGLIIGGVVVGQDLIAAAGVRAQISQIEKYQTAVNTFRGKYGYLPGDMPNPSAVQFGFTTRGSFAGQGDGNGLLQGVLANAAGQNYDEVILSGESGVFWVDLSQANLVDGSFNAASELAPVGAVSAAQVSNYFPAAKIGRDNYVYAWSGGWDGLSGTQNNEYNYFGLSVLFGSYAGVPGLPASNVGVTVLEAYNIDNKIDDGLPQGGRVMAMYDNGSIWAVGGGTVDPAVGRTNGGAWDPATYGPVVAGDGVATAPSASTCYDNGSAAGATEHYSVGQNNGAGINCALSFRFQ
jgi:prepilin-type N-terminal cleavage/methylation domain-containing protein